VPDVTSDGVELRHLRDSGILVREVVECDLGDRPHEGAVDGALDVDVDLRRGRAFYTLQRRRAEALLDQEALDLKGLRFRNADELDVEGERKPERQQFLLRRDRGRSAPRSFAGVVFEANLRVEVQHEPVALGGRSPPDLRTVGEPSVVDASAEKS